MGLKYEDFQNPLFNKTKVAIRRVDGELVYEYVTRTDNFVEIGNTYFLASGVLSIVNTKNQQLFYGKVNSPEELEKAIKKADKKHDRLWMKKK